MFRKVLPRFSLSIIAIFFWIFIFFLNFSNFAFAAVIVEQTDSSVSTPSTIALGASFSGGRAYNGQILGTGFRGSLSTTTIYLSDTNGLGPITPAFRIECYNDSAYDLSTFNSGCSSNLIILPAEKGQPKTQITTSTPLTFDTNKFYRLGIGCYSNCSGGTNPNLITYGTSTDAYPEGDFTAGLNIKDGCFILEGSATIPPPSLSNLQQFKSDSTSAIVEGGITTESQIIFGAVLNSSSTNQLQLQVEVKLFGAAFTNQPSATSTFVAPGSFATTTLNNLTDGSYHWQARIVDSQSNASDWQEFGTAGNVDFVVSLPLSTKAALLAKELINYPYLWGGKGWDFSGGLFADAGAVKTNYKYWNPDANGPGNGDFAFGSGVDCSGLIGWSYNRSSDPLKFFPYNFIKHENADGQYQYDTNPVAESALQPGDLLFFDWGKFNSLSGTWDGIKDGIIDHVGIYTGGDASSNVIQAQSKSSGIRAVSLNIWKGLTGFVAFGRPKNTTIAMSITKSSPVHLSVTDPDGNTVSDTTGIATDEEYIRSSGDLAYATMGVDSDGYPEDIVYSIVLKQGTYRIFVSPMANTTPDQTYSLDFTAGNTTIPLAQNVPLGQIPYTGGYGIVVGADNSITLDTTSPEARIGFSTFTKGMLITGIDDLSATTTVKTAATSTIITDAAGNTLEIIFKKLKQEKSELKLQLDGLFYNGVSISTLPKTKLQYEWSVDKSGNLKELEEKAVVGSLEVEGHYNAKKNVTEIKKKLKENEGDTTDDSGNATEETLPGLVIIKLSTNKGVAGIEY